MKMIQSESKKFVSIMAVFFAVLFGIMANGCGGGGGGGAVDVDGTTVAAPAAPTAFDVYPTPDTTLSATLVWKAPTTGGEVAYYDIYRSVTPGTAYPNQLQATISVSDVNQTDYEFIDNVGLLGRTTYYWVVAARNAGGSAPSDEQSATVRGPANGGGGDTGYGNNLAVAVIFADGVGITGEAITGGWAIDSVTDFNTGFRPTDLQFADLPEFPYYDPTTLVGDLYPQQTVNTWQGEWKDGSGAQQDVNATWGDNLVSQPNLTPQSPVRIEIALSKNLDGVVDENMTTYNMEWISGSGIDELWGTDGTTDSNTTIAKVFAANAELTIQKLDTNGDPIPDMYVVQDQPLWTCDGPGCFGAEVTVSGNLTYGFVWLTAQDQFTDEDTVGTWRITFTLVGDTNTYIDQVAPTAVEGGGTLPVKDSDTSTHIDITIH